MISRFVVKSVFNLLFPLLFSCVRDIEFLEKVSKKFIEDKL